MTIKGLTVRQMRVNRLRRAHKRQQEEERKARLRVPKGLEYVSLTNWLKNQ